MSVGLICKAGELELAIISMLKNDKLQNVCKLKIVCIINQTGQHIINNQYDGYCSIQIDARS